MEKPYRNFDLVGSQNVILILQLKVHLMQSLADSQAVER